MDTEVNKNPEKAIEDISLLKKELKEKRFQIQSLEKRIEEGRRLIGDTILRMRSIQKELQRVREEAERQKFDRVIQKMGDGVVVCTADWKIAAINSSAQKDLNITEPESINLVDFIFINYSVSIPKEEIIDVSRRIKLLMSVREETEQFKACVLSVSLHEIQ